MPSSTVYDVRNVKSLQIRILVCKNPLTDIVSGFCGVVKTYQSVKQYQSGVTTAMEKLATIARRSVSSASCPVCFAFLIKKPIKISCLPMLYLCAIKHKTPNVTHITSTTTMVALKLFVATTNMERTKMTEKAIQCRRMYFIAKTKTGAKSMWTSLFKLLTK